MESVQYMQCSRQQQKGVVKQAPANILRYAKTPDNFTIDKMHGSDLGIAKDIARLWFHSSSHSEDYYVKPEQVRILDHFGYR